MQYVSKRMFVNSLTYQQ